MVHQECLKRLPYTETQYVAVTSIIHEAAKRAGGKSDAAIVAARLGDLDAARRLLEEATALLAVVIHGDAAGTTPALTRRSTPWR